MEILERSSPNYGVRRDGARPDLVVIHHTAMVSAEAAVDRLCDAGAEVSAHYVVAEDGRVWHLVAEEARAWHAGAGQWGQVSDVNSRSIGIELANPGPLDGYPPFPEPQMAALEALLDEIMARWSIPAARIIAHSDMAPGRKADPGPKFDWRRLALAGRAVWPGPAVPVAADPGPVDPRRFAEDAHRIGYPEVEHEALLAAFRLRFRPFATGPLSHGDLFLAEAAARDHPCVDPVGETA